MIEPAFFEYTGRFARNAVSTDKFMCAAKFVIGFGDTQNFIQTLNLLLNFLLTQGLVSYHHKDITLRAPHHLLFLIPRHAFVTWATTAFSAFTGTRIIILVAG